MQTREITSEPGEFEWKTDGISTQGKWWQWNMKGTKRSVESLPRGVWEEGWSILLVAEKNPNLIKDSKG